MDQFFGGITLPPVLRAIFIENWNIDEPIKAFGTNEEPLAEVRSIRPAHNFAPENSVQAVALALRKHVDNDKLERVLLTPPFGASDFWSAAPQKTSPDVGVRSSST